MGAGARVVTDRARRLGSGDRISRGISMKLSFVVLAALVAAPLPVIAQERRT